jgi:hypothetical protein
MTNDEILDDAVDAYSTSIEAFEMLLDLVCITPIQEDTAKKVVESSRKGLQTVRANFELIKCSN